MNTEHQPAADVFDDQCLIHHFIRVHGRSPHADELDALREQATVPAEQPGKAVPVGLAVSSTAHGFRRELARLVHRF
ncbi:hypothetical protein ACFQW6_10350 [Nocardioides sp. GCM10028917]|uniref:hypothetical protein n=1 Tax=Nocardioides sp. GCM10028917 TaxID=3273408 RepID=UPI003623059F